MIENNDFSIELRTRVIIVRIGKGTGIMSSIGQWVNNIKIAESKILFD